MSDSLASPPTASAQRGGARSGSTSGGGGNRNVAEMSENQFKASLDALMETETWMGIHNNSNSNSNTLNKDQTALLASFPLQTSVTTSVNHPGAPKASMPFSSISFIGMPGIGSNFGGTAPHMSFAPASSSVCDSASQTSSRRGKKRTRFDPDAAVSEDEEDRERRRQDRNMREQQRSQQITSQIAHLRSILEQANVQFKPDKYSTLVTVSDYVKQLQARSAMLDTEHKKLLDTITQTTEMVNQQHLPAVSSSSEPMDDGTISPLEADDDAAVFVGGLDYKAVFASCPVACAITSIDGRFLECNQEFVNFSGYDRDELIPFQPDLKGGALCDAKSAKDKGGSPERNMSLFNVLNRTDMERLFNAMSTMLKRPFSSVSVDKESDQADIWNDAVEMARKEGTKVRS